MFAVSGRCYILCIKVIFLNGWEQENDRSYPQNGRIQKKFKSRIRKQLLQLLLMNY